MRSDRVHSIFAAFVTTGLTLLLALPFVWMLLTALKTPSETVALPMAWLPETPQWQNFTKAWSAAPFGRFYINSFIVASLGTVFQLVGAALMAYAFAWVRFPGRRVFLFCVIATLMIQEEMRLIPNYLFVAHSGGIDTYWGLILPQLANAFPVFVFYQHFRTLPTSLLESAEIDGAGHFRILVQIISPMSRPVFAAVAVVAFVGRWNEYLWPLVITNSANMRTLPVGLGYLKESSEGSIEWNLLMSATIFVIIPVLMLYLLAQRQFVEGMTGGALKG